MCVRFIRRRDRERERCASGLYGAGIEREKDHRVLVGERDGQDVFGAHVRARVEARHHMRQRQRLAARDGPADVIHLQAGRTCPISTGGGTRRVRLVREEGRDVSSQPSDTRC